MKLQGFAGIDASGTLNNPPLVVCCVYSDSKSDFDKIYKMIRDVAIKSNPVLGYRKEIKSTDIKSESLMNGILKLTEKFQFVVIDKELFYDLKRKFVRYPQWQLRLEACIWYHSLKGLSPNIVVTDYISNNNYKQKFFEYLITKLASEHFKKSPYFYGASSSSENTVKIADLVAGILRKNPKLGHNYDMKKIMMDEKDVVSSMDSIRFLRK